MKKASGHEKGTRPGQRAWRHLALTFAARPMVIWAHLAALVRAAPMLPPLCPHPPRRCRFAVFEGRILPWDADDIFFDTIHRWRANVSEAPKPNDVMFITIFAGD